VLSERFDDSDESEEAGMASTLKQYSETKPIRIPASVTLSGDLTLPTHPRGLVVFAHGSGSSRLSPRNQRVASHLQFAGFGTLLFDLLTEQEEVLDAQTGHLRFDVELLAERLGEATDWLATLDETRSLAIGFFGASTGAAGALIAAAARPGVVRAVVSRGGRPDLAGDALASVHAPTLLIVGGNDPEVFALNRAALTMLGAPIKKLSVVPNATHLFEESGALEQVADLALGWFDKHLV
jgi:putative phosphoribosyl transferase